jgi:hypothetical protein
MASCFASEQQTFVTIMESSFSEDGDERVQKAIDWHDGFTVFAWLIKNIS